MTDRREVIRGRTFLKIASIFRNYFAIQWYVFCVMQISDWKRTGGKQGKQAPRFADQTKVTRVR
jgi:hypothetical protein